MVSSLSDLLISSAMLPDIGETMPDEFVVQVGEIIGESLNPGIEADREKALEAALKNTGMVVEALDKVREQGVEVMRCVTANCSEKGPLKVRVRPASGPVLLKLCRSDLANAPEGHDHEMTIHYRKDS